MTAAVAALVRERGGSVALTDVTVRAPGAGEVLVAVAASGVCPTDLFGMAGGAGDRFPAVFGHEGAGVVTAVGPGVSRLREGDRVVLSFDSCGECDACRRGHPASCARFAPLNYDAPTDATAGEDAVTTGWMAQSSWSTHVVVRERNAVRIDDDVPWEVAATFGCGVLTGAGTVLNVLRPGPGDTLLVLGAGTTGLAAVMAAAHRGTARIVVSEPSAERRLLALGLGATEAYAPAELPARTLDASAVIDTVGSQAALDTALAALAPLGVCATVALHPGANRVDLSQTRLLWGRTVTGVIEGDADITRDIPLLAALWRTGRLPVERLITTYPFDAIADAVEDARAGRVVKAVLQMAPRPAPRAAPAAGLDALLAETALGQDDLAALWRSLPPVDPEALRGLWRGHGLSPEHPTHRLLTESSWFGKLFRGPDDVVPLVCERDGALIADVAAARGGATLRTVVHRGVATAAMVYDRRPIIDCFTRLSPTQVLGVMTGRGAEGPDGSLYHFVLEKVVDRPVTVDDPHHPRTT
ncbi:alcohol dehydrogenase catalytic domain-containing protein [Microbacterium sp. GXF7504]